MSKPAPLLPMSPLPPLTSKKELPPLSSIKSPLPPPSKKELPPLSSIKSPLSSLPPLTKKKLPPLTSPLAKEVKEKRKEIIKEITEDVTKKEIEQKILPAKTLPPISSKALPPLVSKETKKEIKPLKPLVSSPIFVKEKTTTLPASLPTLKKAQEGVEKAKLIEPEAAFQTKALLPPIPGDQAESPSLATIVSPANLPTKKSKDKTPKIKIPKIKSTMIKPSPKKKKDQDLTHEIILPTESTVIPAIPVKSPTAKKVTKIKKAEASSDDVIKNVMAIDVTKLKTGRVAKKDSGYSVAELKTLAGSLNLTKSGNKKELVERIKQAILKVNPAAFDTEN